MTSRTSILRNLLSVLCLCAITLNAAEFPDPLVDHKSFPADSFHRNQTAVLAGGCFWGVEAVFRQIAGVESAVSGYSGGDAASAHYDIVDSGKTGHAESVQITYDPRKISYGQLLKVFFSVAHDPTQLNRQALDVGPQYRSAIFYLNPEQKKIAEAYVKQLEQAKVFHAPIVTQVVEFKAFYPAEQLHQNFCTRHPRDSWVVRVGQPMVEKTKQEFPELLKK